MGNWTVDLVVLWPIWEHSHLLVWLIEICWTELHVRNHRRGLVKLTTIHLSFLFLLMGKSTVRTKFTLTLSHRKSYLSYKIYNRPSYNWSWVDIEDTWSSEMRLFVDSTILGIKKERKQNWRKLRLISFLVKNLHEQNSNWLLSRTGFLYKENNLPSFQLLQRVVLYLRLGMLYIKRKKKW